MKNQKVHLNKFYNNKKYNIINNKFINQAVILIISKFQFNKIYTKYNNKINVIIVINQNLEFKNQKIT